MSAAIWTAVILAFAALFAYLKVQRFWVEDFTPDCKHYVDLAIDGRTYAPYCYRQLIPLIAGTLSMWHEEDEDAAADWLRRIGTVGIITLPVAVFWLALELGAPLPAAACAALVVIATDSLYGLALTMPWHIDPPAMVLAVAACACGIHGWGIATAILLTILAVTKESLFVFAGVFLGASVQQLEPGAQAGLTVGAMTGALLYAAWRLRTKPVPTEEPSLLHPFRWATLHKAPIWGLYAWNLAALEATPWVAALWLPGSPWALPCALVGILAWGQMLVATDQGRLIAFWVPWGAACVAAVAPPWALAVWVLLSLGWPLKQRDILG